MSDPRPENALLRVLDANFDRAREALRVMEEYARFVLDDGALTAAIKGMRHDLAAAMPSGAISARDTVGDVGCEITTPSEARRDTMQDVVIAAGRRLSEALRALEEYGKVVDPGLAGTIETLRYRGYEIERRLTMTIQARQRFGHVGLYLLLTAESCRGDWLATAHQAIEGGVDCIQLREKNLSDGELLGRARRLVELCRPRGVLTILNDRPDIAVAARTDGVHVGQDDLPVSAVRRIVPASMMVGVSTHTVEQARAAAEQAPDYVAVGPMYDSPTKPQPHIAGPGTLAEVRKLTSLPLVAIGGINGENVGAVLAAGATCVCVGHALLGQAEVTSAARRLRARLDARQSPAAGMGR